ncbi:MAG: hypothetical protein K2N44_09435 [Lachnospiraceae bacterium]|nr:hypothetical protein [Lachnospiraceae bacterium]
MKKRMKIAIRLIGTACISSLLAAGCGSTPAPDTAANQVVDLPSSASDNTAASDARIAQGDTDTDVSDAEQAQNDADTDNAEGKWHVLPPEVASIVDADFEGTVWKIEENSFYIVELITEIIDGGFLSVGGPSPDAEIPDSELILVVFDQNTHFYIRTIYNGGDSYEDTEATFQDIEKERVVAMKGSFENDVFHATEIRINRVS